MRNTRVDISNDGLGGCVRFMYIESSVIVFDG